MKKIYRLFLGALLGGFAFNALAENVKIDPSLEYQFKFNIQAANAEWVYAKAYKTGADNDFLYVGNGAGNDPAAVTNDGETHEISGPLGIPEGSLTEIDRILFDFSWNGNDAEIVISDLQIIDPEGKNLLANATFTTGEPFYAPNWAQTDNFTFAVDGSSIKVALPTYTTDRWQAQFPVSVSVTSSAIDESAVTADIYTSGQTIFVNVPDIASINVYDIAGNNIWSDKTANAQISVSKGIYIVTVDGQATKVSVR